MEKKINIAQLLKDCPSGMELDCTICNNVVTLEGVDKEGYYPIRVMTKSGYHHILTCEGYVYEEEDAKCVIYPKGKTTWEGFQRPFKDGDIVVTMESINYGTWISIFKGNNENGIVTYADFCVDSNSFYQNSPTILCHNYDVITQRIATEEEKQKLFDAIKENGYRWNPKNKTLEKLVTDKFDINTLVPFESKVLVRDGLSSKWLPVIWGFYDEDGCDYHYQVVGGYSFSYCIPYEGNEHLLGTKDDCDDYYKTW